MSSEDIRGSPEKGKEKEKEKAPLLGGRFKVGQKIGSGTFGVLMLGKNTTSGQLVAIKLEEADKKHPSLPIEYDMYRRLGAKEEQVIGIPHIFAFCPYGKYNALVLDLLGPSLQDLRDILRKPFSLKSTLQVALQLISLIEYVHSKKIIYRDNKPENFLFGVPGSSKKNILHIIDFGLSKEYVDEAGKHIPLNEGKPIIGTARYMSINTHLLKETSRRDDLEAIGYVIVYLIKGKLPWQGMKGLSTDDRYKRIGDLKSSTSPEVLCEGLPPEFSSYIRYSRDLEFADTPDYERMKSLFREVTRREGYPTDEVYDWTGKSGKTLRTTSRTSQTDNESNVKIKGSRG